MSKLHVFIETRNLSRWEFLQHGIFPAPDSFQNIATKWHQPFQFEDPRVDKLFFGDPSILSHRTLPPDLSADLRVIRNHHPIVKDEGYVYVNELLVVRTDKEHLRIPVPPDTSVFWRDLRILADLGMPHRVRLILWQS